jgi:hypothetical protein
MVSAILFTGRNTGTLSFSGVTLTNTILNLGFSFRGGGSGLRAKGTPNFWFIINAKCAAESSKLLMPFSDI